MYQLASCFIPFQTIFTLAYWKKFHVLPGVALACFFLCQEKAYSGEKVFLNRAATVSLSLGVNRKVTMADGQGSVRDSSRLSQVSSLSLAAVQEGDSLAMAIQNASLVLTGKVIEAGMEDNHFPRTVSEHNPDLRFAVVECQEIFKGKSTRKKLKVYYAASEDVLWYHSPKLHKGQKAVFLLQKKQLTGFSGIEHYTVLTRWDVQPLSQRRKIKAILQKARADQ